MKEFFSSFYCRLSLIFMLLLLVMGIAQVLFTFESATTFHRDASQQLNRNLASDMLPDFQPVLKDSVNLSAIEEMIHYMMVINPRIELYLLDDHGKILSYFTGPGKEVVLEKIDLEPVREFFDDDQASLILGDDPRFAGREKPFSVAPLQLGPDMNGYLYIIIGGEQFDSAAASLRQSYLQSAYVRGLLFSFLMTALLGLLVFAFLTRRLRRMTTVVQKFEAGDLRQRVEADAADEISLLAGAFNKMADTISANVDELKRTDQLRRDLVANVSHDLRSPLASVKGYLETIQMKEGQLTADQHRRYIEVLLNTTTHLERLVEQLFELSKLDARQIQPRFEAFPVADLVQDVLMKLRPVAERSGITLDVALPRQLPLVYADIGLIERALTNLMENAIRYTPEGGRIQIEINQRNDKVEIQVADTGCGIPEQDLPYIFDRFYRAEKSRARSTGGSGLGLSITKKILELHESLISVRSRVGEGTRFAFQLGTAGPH